MTILSTGFVNKNVSTAVFFNKIHSSVVNKI